MLFKRVPLLGLFAVVVFLYRFVDGDKYKPRCYKQR